MDPRKTARTVTRHRPRARNAGRVGRNSPGIGGRGMQAGPRDDDDAPRRRSRCDRPAVPRPRTVHRRTDGRGDCVWRSLVEIALIVSRTQTLGDFTARSASPENQQHDDARVLLERLGGVEALGEMHDAYTMMLDGRPNAHRVTVTR